MSNNTPLTGFYLRAECEDDHGAISHLHRQAFGEHGDRVVELVDALRSATAALPVESFVAVAHDQVVGHIMLSAAMLDAPKRLVDVYTLSPLAVLPNMQRLGIGTSLVRHVIGFAAESGIPLVFLEGDPNYYKRHGFVDAELLSIKSPTYRIGPGGCQLYQLPAYETWMTGAFVYRNVFWDHDCVGQRQ